MNEILEVAKLTDLIVLGVCVASFTQLAKVFLPDEIENNVIMVIAVVLGGVFGYLGFLLGAIEVMSTAVVEGILAGGIVSGGISLVFDAINKLKPKE